MPEVAMVWVHDAAVPAVALPAPVASQATAIYSPLALLRGSCLPARYSVPAPCIHVGADVEPRAVEGCLPANPRRGSRRWDGHNRERIQMYAKECRVLMGVNHEDVDV